MADKINIPKKGYKKNELPETKEDWVSYIEELHEIGLAERRKYEFQWVVNLAYYMGYQSLLFNPRTGLLELPRELKQPLTVNRISSFVDARHAKLTKARPVARVVPDTQDIADKMAAKAADQALMHLWRKVDMDHEYDKLFMQMLIYGVAFMKTLWDPLEGDYIEEYRRSGEDNKVLEMDEMGQPIQDKVFLGEVATKAMSPFGLLVGNDSILDMKDQPWVMDRSHHSIVDLETRFPKLKGKIKKEETEANFTEYEKIVQRLSSPIFKSVGASGLSVRDEINSQALVKTLWIKPNHVWEDGVVAVSVGKELALIDVWPNDFGRNKYPYVKFSEKEDGAHFFQQATLERLIPIQRAYNSLKQQRLKNAKLMAVGKWLLPKGSQVQADSITDEEGEVIEYNPAVPKPEQSPMAPLPAYVAELDKELIMDFRDVAGQRETSTNPAPQFTASVAMQTAAELSDEVMGSIVKRASRSMELVANQQLLLMDQEYIEPRKIKIIGDTGAVAAQWLSNADFRHHTDVHVEIDSMLPEFRGSKVQRLFDLWDRRIIQDPAQFLNAMRFGSYEGLINQEESMEEQIAMDIARIKKGKAPEIHPFQNHILYIKQLSKWVQTPDFMKLIPERKQLALQVLQQHLMALQGQMAGPQGEPQPEQNQAAVGTEFGPQRPAAA